MEYIKMIVMTESSKNSGRCVAGIKIDDGKWIRVVSSDKNTYGALSSHDLVYVDGTRCNILDVVSVPIICACGDEIQPENMLLDRSQHIIYEGKASLREVLAIHPEEVRNGIFGNALSFVSERNIKCIGYSLMLIQVKCLTLHQVETMEGKKKIKASFLYQGEYHQQLSVTDPDFYWAITGTVYDTARLVVSIGMPYKERHYKFVSKIFV